MRAAWTTGTATLRARMINPQQLAAPAPDAEMPPYMESFLASLRLLIGVPFDYLAADSRLLPQESIRFFYLDRSWADRLVDGAISVGKIGTREQAHHQAHAPTVQQQLDVSERIVRILQRGLADFTTAKTTNDHTTLPLPMRVGGRRVVAAAQLRKDIIKKDSDLSSQPGMPHLPAQTGAAGYAISVLNPPWPALPGAGWSARRHRHIHRIHLHYACGGAARVDAGGEGAGEMSGFASLNVAMAAAHGLTDRVVATWNPALPRDPRVMAPIIVDALAVRQTGASWANTQMQRTPAGTNANAVPAKDLLPKPFTLRGQERPRGVYLHWALPEALTQGSQSSGASGAQGGPVFPALPDRWLITRIFPSATRADRRAVRSWILQAHDDNPQPIDLDSWTDPGKTPDGIKNPLTALGYGDLSWAGFFDNTQNRLAFYDDLIDVAQGPVAYLVCGWFSDPEHDPLGPATVNSLADFYSRMQGLGWALTAGDLEQARAAAANLVVAAKAAGLPVTSPRASITLNQFANTGVMTATGGLGATGGETTFDPGVRNFFDGSILVAADEHPAWRRGGYRVAWNWLGRQPGRRLGSAGCGGGCCGSDRW